MTERFEDWLLRTAALNTILSQDPRTHIAALLYDIDNEELLSLGYNRLSEGFCKEDLQTCNKYHVMVHAEQDAIHQYFFNTSKKPKLNLGLVATAACCTECAKVIVAAGVKEVVTSRIALEAMPSWSDNIEAGHQILKKGGVELIMIDKPVGVQVLISGKKVTI